MKGDKQFFLFTILFFVSLSELLASKSCYKSVQCLTLTRYRLCVEGIGYYPRRPLICPSGYVCNKEIGFNSHSPCVRKHQLRVQNHGCFNFKKLPAPICNQYYLCVRSEFGYKKKLQNCPRGTAFYKTSCISSQLTNCKPSKDDSQDDLEYEDKTDESYDSSVDSFEDASGDQSSSMFRKKLFRAYSNSKLLKCFGSIPAPTCSHYYKFKKLNSKICILERKRCPTGQGFSRKKLRCVSLNKAQCKKLDSSEKIKNSTPLEESTTVSSTKAVTKPAGSNMEVINPLIINLISPNIPKAIFVISKYKKCNKSVHDESRESILTTEKSLLSTSLEKTSNQPNKPEKNATAKPVISTSSEVHISSENPITVSSTLRTKVLTEPGESNIKTKRPLVVDIKMPDMPKGIFVISKCKNCNKTENIPKPNPVTTQSTPVELKVSTTEVFSTSSTREKDLKISYSTESNNFSMETTVLDESTKAPISETNIITTETSLLPTIFETTFTQPTVAQQETTEVFVSSEQSTTVGLLVTSTDTNLPEDNSEFGISTVTPTEDKIYTETPSEATATEIASGTALQETDTPIGTTLLENISTQTKVTLSTVTETVSTQTNTENTSSETVSTLKNQITTQTPTSDANIIVKFSASKCTEYYECTDYTCSTKNLKTCEDGKAFDKTDCFPIEETSCNLTEAPDIIFSTSSTSSSSITNEINLETLSETTATEITSVTSTLQETEVPLSTVTETISPQTDIENTSLETINTSAENKISNDTTQTPTSDANIIAKFPASKCTQYYECIISTDYTCREKILQTCEEGKAFNKTDCFPIEETSCNITTTDTIDKETPSEPISTQTTTENISLETIRTSTENEIIIDSTTTTTSNANIIAKFPAIKCNQYYECIISKDYTCNNKTLKTCEEGKAFDKTDCFLIEETSCNIAAASDVIFVTTTDTINKETSSEAISTQTTTGNTYLETIHTSTENEIIIDSTTTITSNITEASDVNFVTTADTINKETSSEAISIQTTTENISLETIRTSTENDIIIDSTTTTTSNANIIAKFPAIKCNQYYECILSKDYTCSNKTLKTCEEGKAFEKTDCILIEETSCNITKAPDITFSTFSTSFSSKLFTTSSSTINKMNTERLSDAAATKITGVTLSVRETEVALSTVTETVVPQTETKDKNIIAKFPASKCTEYYECQMSTNYTCRKKILKTCDDGKAFNKTDCFPIKETSCNITKAPETSFTRTPSTVTKRQSNKIILETTTNANNPVLKRKRHRCKKEGVFRGPVCNQYYECKRKVSEPTYKLRLKTCPENFAFNGKKCVSIEKTKCVIAFLSDSGLKCFGLGKLPAPQCNQYFLCKGSKDKMSSKLELRTCKKGQAYSRNRCRPIEHTHCILPKKAEKSNQDKNKDIDKSKPFTNEKAVIKLLPQFNLPGFTRDIPKLIGINDSGGVNSQSIKNKRATKNPIRGGNSELLITKCTRVGKFPAAHSCRRYYQCKINQNNWFVLNFKKCPTGQAFDKTRCVPVDQTDCKEPEI